MHKTRKCMCAINMRFGKGTYLGFVCVFGNSKMHGKKRAVIQAYWRTRRGVAHQGAGGSRLSCRSCGCSHTGLGSLKAPWPPVSELPF